MEPKQGTGEVKANTKLPDVIVLGSDLTDGNGSSIRQLSQGAGDDVISPSMLCEHPPEIQEERVALDEHASKRNRRNAAQRMLWQQTLLSPRSPKKKKQERKSTDSTGAYDTVWICAECKEAECMIQPNADQFIICDGPCNRLFHYPCAGLLELPANDQNWFCKDCTNHQHLCALCQEYGMDNEDVFPCRKERCGLFFHEACLSMYNVEVTMVKQGVKMSATNNDGAPTPLTIALTAVNGDESNNVHKPELEDIADIDPIEPTYSPVFTCPAHWCWTCTQTIHEENEKDEDDVKGKSKKRKRGKRRGKSSLQVAFQAKTETRLFVCD